MKNKIVKKIIKKKDDFRGYQLVYQDNRLIESKYDLTLQEKKLILFAISKIKVKDFHVEPIVFSCRELSDLCGLKGDSFYTELRKTTAKLMGRVFVIRNLDNHTYTQINWVTQSTYHEKKGIVEIKFNNSLCGFLLDLKKNFTSIPLSQTLSLSSIYAIRIFELLKQYENIGERIMNLDDLREKLGISKTKLASYKDFKKNVIIISQRELSLKTNIRFDFEEIKTSRKITSIRFFIYSNDPEQNKKKEERTKRIGMIKAELRENDSHKKLLEIGYSRQAIQTFLKKYSEDKIKKALSVVLDQIEKGQAMNPKALFRSALKNDWSLDKFVVRKSE